MRILVTGGRTFKDMALVDEALCWFTSLGAPPGPVPEDKEITVIEGGATGADALARKVAERLGWKVETFPADWKLYGRAAGPHRNQQMIDEGKPDLVLAFEGGIGTANMTKLALAAGVRVTEVRRVGGRLLFVHRHLLPEGAQL